MRCWANQSRAAPLDLATVAEDALEGRALSGITTTSTLDQAPVAGDGVLLERLIANLLDNAERYNVDGGTIAIFVGKPEPINAKERRQGVLDELAGEKDAKGK